MWIGYLRWHLRTKGEPPTEPILREFRNIEKCDAVLEHDGYTREGDKVAYQNPRRPEWPEADYIVGNPPFIGGKDIRSRLGDGYAEALWAAHEHMNESADFVMYWWDRAAELLTRKNTTIKRFGLVTTNSITQVFQRRVVERHLKARQPVSILMAIPDHPWTKEVRHAAAVRIAMTVAAAGSHEGVLREVVKEEALDTDEPRIEFRESLGLLNPDLTIGVDVTKATPLVASEGLCSPGVKLHGSGFIVSPKEAAHLGLGERPGLEKFVRPYRNGRDLNGTSRAVMVIDLFDMDADEVRTLYPEVYQHVLQAVKPERDQNNRESYKRHWWIFGEPRKDLRPALEGLPRYIATVETSKHRTFQFLDAEILPDNMLVCVALSDAFHLGVLSSRVHVAWTLMQGGTLEDRPRYTKSHCFDPFPFPEADPLIHAEIAHIGEKIDKHRKDVQAAHPDITLTQMYNVLEKLRGVAEGTPHRIARQQLAVAEEDIKTRGLVLILKEYHDELNRLVFKAYGWPETLSDDEILGRLLALNKERAKEEARVIVKWLRPDYQISRFGKAQDRLKLEGGEDHAAEAGVAAKKVKPAFPQEAVAQTAAVMMALAEASKPVSASDLAQGYKQGRKAEARIAATLASLARTGFVTVHNGGRQLSLRRAA